MNKEEIINKKLQSLSKSKFRNSFSLNKKQIEYINNKGIIEIKNHAFKIINERLKPSKIENDGHQTPYKGHPIFVAQHACACCCRSCLYKWHNISIDKELTDNEINYIVTLLMYWIKNNLKSKKM